MSPTLEAVQMSRSSLPVIDISGLSSSDPADRKAVGAELRTACRHNGFFYISHHGIPEDIVASVFSEAAAFFDLPTEQKTAVDKSRSKANRGYEPMQGQTLEPGAPPDLPETFVVNLGDMIARWTNERYHSTLHRVVNASGQERYSVPFFCTGNYAHQVACIPTCLAPGEQPKYPPITVEDHMRAMYRRTYK